MKIFLFTACLFLCICYPYRSDAQPMQDTLGITKQLRDQGKIKKAVGLLKIYQSHHPEDLNAEWLLAQTTYWAKKFNKSRLLYEDAIKSHPDNLYLQLDYANMLVEIGKYKKAKPILDRYLAYDPSNSQALLAMAKMSYWKGDYKEAAGEVKKVVQNNPDNKAAAALLTEIVLAESPWINLGASYVSDNQPLQSISPIVESGIYLDALSTLRFKFQGPIFKQKKGKITNALWLQAGNAFYFWKAGLKINVDAGVLKYSYKNTTTWTANLELEKTFARHLILWAQVERKPYFATGSSVDTMINENHYAAAIGWNNTNSWNGQIALHIDHFLADKNTLHALSVWMFAPPLNASVFTFRLGYGYSFSSAKENRFVPEEPDADVIANYDSTQDIKGIYDPYFTPDDQRIHSFLVAIGIRPVNGFDIGISGNLGFYATAEIPYFYLDKDKSGQVVVVKAFSRETYFPFSIKACASVQVSRKISIRLDYGYSSTYFYNSHYAGLGLKIYFWNAKKRN